jgi:hypothetical protein
MVRCAGHGEIAPPYHWHERARHNGRSHRPRDGGYPSSDELQAMGVLVLAESM